MKFFLTTVSCILFSFSLYSQENLNTSAAKTFTSVDQLLNYSTTKSILLSNNKIQLDEAKKAKLAAVLGTIDITGNLLSAQFVNNTTIGVNLLPSEIFGGTPGTFQEVPMGVQYNTNLNNYADIKLINFAGWANLKLANINIDITESNNQMSLKNLQENIANNYFNIVNLKAQIATSKENLKASDTLLAITQNKYNKGLIKQQDVNQVKVNHLNLEESVRQLSYLLDQYYISLKILIDLPENEEIIIDNQAAEFNQISPEINLNTVKLETVLLQEKYKKVNLNAVKATFLPTVSLQFSNSNNLYNTTFNPLQGNWINSNYIGLRMHIPIPSAKSISKMYVAKYDLLTAENNTKQIEIQTELNKKTLELDYQKAISQLASHQEILAISEDTYNKNKNLYKEGLLSLEVTLDSFNKMIAAKYNFLSSQSNVQLVLSKISINNNIN